MACEITKSRGGRTISGASESSASDTVVLAPADKSLIEIYSPVLGSRGNFELEVCGVLILYGAHKILIGHVNASVSQETVVILLHSHEVAPRISLREIAEFGSDLILPCPPLNLPPLSKDIVACYRLA